MQIASPAQLGSDSLRSIPPAQGKARWPLVAMIVGVVALLVLFAGGMILIPRYQAAHPYTNLQRSDANRVHIDDLFLDVTLVTAEFRQHRNLDHYFGQRDPETVLPVLVGLNTHTGNIGHMRHLPGELVLVGPDGQRYPAITEPIVLSQHHNAYMLLFPARDNRGVRFLELDSGTLTVEASGMGKEPVRSFAWDLPVGAATGDNSSGLIARLMLTVALVSALLVVLSPCALELTLYYTAIISCTVTEGERACGRADVIDPARVGQRRVLLNLASFVAGFTLLYALSGATIGLIGAGMRQPLGPYSGAIQIFGGSVILLFAARVAGVDRWMRSRLPRRSQSGHPAVYPQDGVWERVRQWLGALRERGLARRREGGMRARDSFLVGMGLSSACLTCMGGAVLYPLLVYAGLTSWYSGLITLSLYSLFIAVPMVFIALGFFQIQMSLQGRVRFNRVLRFASAFMLAGIGMLILTGKERIITDLAFRFLGAVSRWSA